MRANPCQLGGHAAAAICRRLSPRGKARAPEHPLYSLLHEQANPEMTAFELRRWLMQGVLLWSNRYAEIAWSDAGTVTALWPLRPDRVEVERRALAAPPLPESYTLPIVYAQLGPHRIRAGAFDYDAFVRKHDEGGTPLNDEQRTILREGSDTQVVIDQANAHFLLNLLWAVGLVNNNPILLAGKMMSESKAKIEQYASTGAWTLAKQPIHMLCAGSAFTMLTAPQQARLEAAASVVYRLCCDNATDFPDCNHGMEMLGLLELIAAQDASVDAMLETAKMVNRFWFPEQTSDLALYAHAQWTQTFDTIPAREAVSKECFSASGYGQVHNWMVVNGRIGAQEQGGGNCGV